jgi:hypothetical protein
MVQTAPFDGTPSALLTRVNEIDADLESVQGSAGATTRRYAVGTRHGAVGVAQDFVGIDKQGTIVAFVFRSHGQSTGEGVKVVVAGSNASISRRRDDIVAMIRSISMAS